MSWSNGCQIFEIYIYLQILIKTSKNPGGRTRIPISQLFFLGQKSFDSIDYFD